MAAIIDANLDMNYLRGRNSTSGSAETNTRKVIGCFVVTAITQFTIPLTTVAHIGEEFLPEGKDGTCDGL